MQRRRLRCVSWRGSWVLVFISIVMMIGCADFFTLGLVDLGGNNNNDGEAVTVVPADLDNRAFAFDNPPDAIETILGLTNSVAFTLDFGDFEGNTGTFTLTTEDNETANGTVILADAQATFMVTMSSFPSGEGPQEGFEGVSDPTTINTNDALILTDPDSEEEVISGPGSDSRAASGRIRQ